MVRRMWSGYLRTYVYHVAGLSLSPSPFNGRSRDHLTNVHPVFPLYFRSPFSSRIQMAFLLASLTIAVFRRSFCQWQHLDPFGLLFYYPEHSQIWCMSGLICYRSCPPPQSIHFASGALSQASSTVPLPSRFAISRIASLTLRPGLAHHLGLPSHPFA